MNSATILFLALGLVAVASAIGMLLTRNTVYSALLLILNFATLAVIYLVLGAPFIAFAQVTIYAGAIMVLFLFVIMLLGPSQAPLLENLPGQRPLAIISGVIILLEAMYILVIQGGVKLTLFTPGAKFANPTDIGTL